MLPVGTLTKRRPSWSVVLVVSLCCACAGACAVSVPLEDRPCPCDETRGFRCDESSGICVRDDGARCGVVGAEASSVQILNLHTVWRIDRAAEIRWMISEEDRTSLSRYELVIGTDREAVVARGPGVTVFGGASVEHPELLRFAFPTDGGDPVVRTVLRDLMPDTVYYVVLVGVDDAGRLACTDPLEFRTWLDARREISIFDEDPHDWAMPACGIEHVRDQPRASSGTAFTQYDALCPTDPFEPPCDEPTDTAPRCFEHVRIFRNDPVPLTPGTGAFENVGAAVVDVAVDDSEHSYWTEFFITTRAPTLEEDPRSLGGGRYLWRSPRQTLVADGAYRSYSMPFSQMTLQCFEPQRALDTDNSQCDRPLTPEDLSRGINGVRVGALLDRGGTLRMDNARIRY